MRRDGAQRLDDDLLRRAALTVEDARQRDEMAGPSYLHPLGPIRWIFWRRLDVVARLLGPGPFDRGLDFGCGLGVLLPTLAAVTREVVAADIEPRPAAVTIAAQRLDNVQLVSATRLRAAVAEASLDYVIATDVLEHVEDLPAIVGWLHRVLRPGGRLIVSGPTENTWYKAARVLAGFAGKGDYHHTDIHRIHEVIERQEFATTARRRLPIPGVVEGFHVYAYER